MVCEEGLRKGEGEKGDEDASFLSSTRAKKRRRGKQREREGETYRIGQQSSSSHHTLDSRLSTNVLHVLVRPSVSVRDDWDSIVDEGGGESYSWKIDGLS